MPAEAATGSAAKSPRKLTVARVIAETPDASSIAFQVPTGDDQLRHYRPGQYLTLQVPSERTGSVARCYSLSSSPHHDDDLVVTIKRTASGYASNWLCDNVSAGDEMMVLPPNGRFTPKSLDGDLLLFAGGSGITPVYSILRSALTEGSGSLTLFYANRNETSVIFAKELDELARKHPTRFELIHWLESVQGIPDAAIIGRLAARNSGHEAYICGPGPFMDGVSAAIESAGFSHKQIHKEVYTSLSGNPFEETDPPPAVKPGTSEATDPADGVEVEVELDGDTHTFLWPRTTSLVDVLLARGVDVPYMCRDGECGSCQATIERGDITMMRNDILDDEDIADGYVLACQALPQGDDPIRIVF